MDATPRLLAEHVADTTLTMTMKGYFNPLIITIIFFTCWVLLFMKAGGSALASGRGGGRVHTSPQIYLPLLSYCS